MKFLALLGTFLCTFVMVQVYTWNVAYPKTPVNLGFSRRPARSLFGKSVDNRRFQSYLTPARNIQRQHVRQRNIRDLMTQLVGNNHRTSMSHPTFNRQTAQRMIARPATGMRDRGANFHSAYREAFAIPSSTVRHSRNQNPRQQTMVIREPHLRNINISPALRPQQAFHRAPMRAPALQKQHVLKEIQGIAPPSTRYSPNQQSTSLLDSAALTDILSSSTDNRLRGQKAPKRVEVIHHIPMTMNPSKLKTGGSAVVYISKPKHGAQIPQGMFMRNLPQTPMLSTGQNKLTQNPSFIMRQHGSVLSTSNNLKQGMNALKNGLQNPHFVTSNSKPFQQHVQIPYRVPTAGMKEKYVTDGLRDHRNTESTSVLKHVPQPHVLRAVAPNINIKQGISESHARPISTTQSKIPRINRLKQELNAEIEQLLKLVPQTSVPVTKKPKLMIQQQIPHPFLIPSPQFTGNIGNNNQIKSPLSPEVSRNLPKNQMIPVSNSKPEIQQPPMMTLNMKEEFLKEHSLKDMKLPNIPEMLSLSHRRPVVSQSTVDSEELSEILESIGYPGRNKVIHNMAGREPVKLIIPDQSKEIKHVVNSSSSAENLSPYTNVDTHPSTAEISSPFYGEDLHSTNTENLSPYESEDLHPSKTDNLPPYHNEGIHPPNTDNLQPYNSEDIPSTNTEISPPYYSEDIHPLETENLSPFKYGNVHFSDNGDLMSPEIEDLPPSDTEDKIHISNNGSSNENLNESDLTLSNNGELESNKSSLLKKYWDFRNENDDLQTSTPQIIETDLKLDTNEKEVAFSHSANNYQGQESVASISVKEEFPLDEEIKKRYRQKQETLKHNPGTLHDIYNKRIYNENIEAIPPSQFVRYFPQRLFPNEAEILQAPGTENKIIAPDTTTKAYENYELIQNTEPPNVSLTKVAYLTSRPQENNAKTFPLLNMQDNPASQIPTEIPKHLTTSKNINISQFHRSTPRYVITKTPYRQPYYNNRNKSRNENGLIPKYIVPERQQFENQRMNTSEYIVSQVMRQHPTNPRVRNFGFRQFTTDATTSLQSSFNSDEYKSKNPENIEESRLKYADMTGFTTTTDIPEVTTYSSFEFGTAESQVENTQEVKNNANDFHIPEMPETSTTANKQFFRGPQHSIVYEDFTTNSFQEPTTDFMPYVSSETTVTPTTTVTDAPQLYPFTQYNEPGVRQYSVHSQTKVINALHLANRVFGRRNHTSSKQPASTTKMPQFRHKFTYAPVIKSSTKPTTTQPEYTTTSRRVVFNFRTGTTHSIPTRVSSAAPKVVIIPLNRNKLAPKSRNDSLDVISDIKEENRIISSSSPRNVFQHIVFSQPNITSKTTHKQSAVTETNKNLYGILKPITKPYNSSTVPIIEKELIKITTKSFKVQISSTTIKPTSPISTFLSTENIKYSSTLASGDSSSTDTDLSKTSSTEKDFIKETASGEVTETTMPFTNPIMTEVQTDAASKNEDRKTEIYLEANVTTTPTPKELTTEPINQEQIVVDSLKSMKLKMQDMASKGLRHLMPLVMELSSDVSISSDCTFSLLRWLRAVRTMEQWAVRMMDASSKIPEGILYGTFSTFGSYDECVAIKTPKINLQMPYSGQYCSINIQPILPPSERHFTIQNAFRKYPKLKQVFQEMNIEEDTMAYYYILKHRIGLCMPSTCSIEDLGNVTEKLGEELKMKISVERCETSEKPSLTRGQIISMCSVFITFGIVILATIIDLSMRVKSDHEMDIDEIIRKKNGIRQFSFVFSAFGNARKILDTSIPATHLSSLHGIKFLSITWVMLGHVYYCKDYLTLAGLNKVRDLGSNLAFQVVLNSAYGADTFFFLSGLLVVYSTFLYLENNNGHFTIVGFYIRRYWRLTPAFLMISGVILLGPLAGSGPIWHETLEPFVSGCQNYWWTNLFYFSNFVPTDKTCVPHGWFLSCDMQFYIVAPIIILALYRRPKLGILLIILGILSSMITTGFLTFLYNLPPVSLFSLPDPKDINEYLDTVGYKPYAHYASYCVGMATGFLLAAKQKISISKCLQTFGWVASTIGCFLVIYGTWNWNSGELPDWPVSVAYATTSRTVWCLGVAWVTIVCYAGHGGPVNTILSWHGFIPLSRLSYLAYLIHPLLMYLYASYVRSPFYFSQYVVVYLYLGHLCVTFGLAFLFSLAFEVPFLNLEKVVTKYLDKSKRKRRASFSNHHNNWQHPEHPELKDSVVLMRRRADKFLT